MHMHNSYVAWTWLLLLPLCPAAEHLWDLMEFPMECGEVQGERLSCRQFFRALDYAPFVNNHFGLLMTLNLVQLPNNSNQVDDELLWSLSSLEVTKLEDQDPVVWTKVSPTVNFFGIYLLTPAMGFTLFAEYGASHHPVAVSRLNATCWASHRNSECIEETFILKSLLKQKGQGIPNPYNEPYWNYIRHMHVKTLNASSIKVNLEMDPVLEKTVNAQLHVQHILKDTPLTSLRIVNLNLTKLQLGEQIRMNHLELEGTKLTTEDAAMLLSAPNLQRLSLAHNNMEYIPPEISNLRNLTFLDLSYNPINLTYSSRILSTLKNLTWLNLAGVPLKNLSSLSLALEQPNSKILLSVLNLSSCSLTDFNYTDVKNMFEHQINLKVLNLSNNLIERVPHDFSDRLYNLEFLSLSYNKINSPPNFHISNSNGLKILDLSGNLLTTPFGIVENGTVEKLILKGNKILSWNEPYLFSSSKDSNKPHVSAIDLSNCRINTVSEKMQQSFANLMEVDLGGNPFNCLDCSLLEFKTWLSDRYSNDSQEGPKILNHRTEKILGCINPPYLAGTPILEAPENSFCKTDYIIIIGIPLVAIFALAVFIMGILHFYRFEITYVIHLLKIRKRRLANAMMSKTFQYDAFVCYSGKDRNWVIKKLVPQLENGPQKYRLCLHERDFILGSIISRNIVRFMQESKNTIVILTKNFVQSQWCQWELEMANHKVFAEDREFLIFIELERLERQSLPRHLRYLMDTRTYLEWPTGEERTLEVEQNLWKRLRTAMGPSIVQRNSHHHTYLQND